ncbi:MAG: hypothetical protein E7273_15145 [Pseudobutyrivibrio ruminis]|nr:hypothetical protein [Pseudobutyrivibrio ruminis]
MFNLISYFVLSPLQYIFQGFYEIILLFVSNFGVGILCLSILTALILIPIEKAVRGSILKEKEIETVLQPQLEDIKKNLHGLEKNNAIKRLYSRYGYSPIYAVRNVYGILIQLPFLIGAYLMLSSYDNLNGHGFMFIKDLSQEDHLLGPINLLPVLMTLVNISTLLFLNLSKRENIQTGIIALAFLVLLYTAQSALLIYWTMNNVIHLLRAIFNRYLLKKFKKVKEQLLSLFYQKVVQLKQLVIVNKLKEQIIDKTDNDYFKKSWIYYILLVFFTTTISITNNFGFYSPDEIARSLALLFIICLVFVGIYLIAKRIFCKEKSHRLLLIFILISIGSAIFYQTTGHFIVHPLPKVTRIVLIGAVFFLVYIVGHIKILNIILMLNIVIRVVNGGITNLVAQQEFYSSVNKINKESDTSNIELNEKPNIYYFLCESMNSLDIAQNTYGLDKETADSFKAFLKENGFYVPDFVYSNAHHTLKTMQTVYLMSDYVGGDKGNDDGSTAVRPMLAGNEHNRLLKLLKNNGYYTSSYMMYGYFTAPKGKYLDYYDSDAKDMRNFSPIMESSKIIYNVIMKYLLRDKVNIIETESKDIIEKYFNNEPQKPHFMFHRPKYTFHTGEEGFSIEKRKEWKPLYLKSYYEELEALKTLTTEILKKDPDAVIVMIGDHGAHLYRSNAKNYAELQQDLNNSHITYEDFINDKFKVFAAVRLPKKYGHINELFSPGNIFPIIFNKIGYEGEKIKINDNNSYFTGYVEEDKAVIHNGVIIDPLKIAKSK